ncbi:MAG TPA: GtrA family protein [Gaiellaceae bacterium]
MVAGQFLKFAVVGAGNTALSWLVFLALASVGMPSPAAAAAAFAAGAVNGYVWNSRWTFGARGPLRYLVVQLGGLVGTAGLVALLASPLGGHVAYAVTTVAVTVATFWANRTWALAPSGEGERRWIRTRTNAAG